MRSKKKSGNPIKVERPDNGLPGRSVTIYIYAMLLQADPSLQAQMMAKEYKSRGGGNKTEKKAQDESQKHLSKWTEEEWPC